MFHNENFTYLFNEISSIIIRKKISYKVSKAVEI
jgi:hypothetical protein